MYKKMGSEDEQLEVG